MLCMAALFTGSAHAVDTEAVLEYLRRSEALTPGDVDSHMSLAQWCEQRQLRQQAAQLYQRVLVMQPDHEQAYPALVKIRDTTPLPDEADRLVKLGAVFGPRFRRHLTDHFIVYFDTDEAFARSRAAALEKAHDAFQSTFRGLGFRPIPLDKRLVAVIFAAHDQYVAHARRHERVDPGWMAGFYAPRSNHIVFYDDRQSPIFDDDRQRIDQLRARQAGFTSATANQARVIHHQHMAAMISRQIDHHEQRLKILAQQGNTEKTLHEAIHQLSFNSGIQVRGRQYPLWVSEGLATCFEGWDLEQSIGPASDNPIRRTALARALADNELLPLGDLLVLTEYPRKREAQQAFYAEAWALFRYVLRYYPDAMRQYLRRLSEATPAPPQQARRRFVALFVEQFGPLDDFERCFRKHLQSLE